MLKAFGYIDKVVKSDFFSRKIPILLHTCASCSELPSYIGNMHDMDPDPSFHYDREPESQNGTGSESSQDQEQDHDWEMDPS